jgi:MFS family permease
MTVAGSIGSLGGKAMTFLPVYFTSLGGSVTQYGIVTALGMLVGIPSTIIGGIIVPKQGLKRIAILTSWFGPCILLGYYLSSDWITLSIIMTVGAAGTIGSSTSRQLIADATISKNRTAQLSLYQTLANIPSMFSPVIGGYLVNTMGIVEGFRSGVAIAVVTSFLSTFLIVKFLNESKDNSSSNPQSKTSDQKTFGRRPKLLNEIQFNPFYRFKPKSENISRVDSNNSGYEASSATHFRGFFRNMASLPKSLAPLLTAYILMIIANSTTGPYYIF